MKLLNRPGVMTPPEPSLLSALAICVAHRCLDHREIPPLNYAEGNGSSECGACVAEQMGTQFAEQALTLHERDVLWPVLDAYADRLEHHALLRSTLGRARDRLNILSPGAGDFIQEVLDGAL